MQRYLFIIISLALVLLGTACSKNKAALPDGQLKPTLESAKEQLYTTELAMQNNRFAFRLYEQVNQPGENLLFSPYSINTAMGMAYTGAKGKTADEMAKVMGYDLEPDKQHLAFGESIRQLNKISERKSAQLYVANAIFNAESNRPYLNPVFPVLLEKSFESELHHLDFNKSRETAAFINKWVEKRTNDRIKDIITERQIATSGDGLVLVNSIFFKAPWQTAFDPKATREDRFFVAHDGKQMEYINVPMMHQTADFGYAELADTQILEMPFEDTNLSMVFILPQDMQKAEDKLNIKDWEGWMKELSKPQKVEVFLPRFNLEASLDKLPESFIKMGMQSAFDGNLADFTGIMDPKRGNLYISDIVHKAFLEVLESGTEAAAATQVGFAKMSYQPLPDKIPVFRADRPFFCMILHKEANEILFAAKVLKPNPAKE